MNERTKNVYLVEDSAPLRARLLEMLLDIEGVNVVGEAGAPAEAIAGIISTRPDYVVLDFQLEGGVGTDVLRAVRPQIPEIVFIVLTNHAQAQFRQLCMDAGADAFLDKSSEFGQVRDLIVGRLTPYHERSYANAN